MALLVGSPLAFLTGTGLSIQVIPLLARQGGSFRPSIGPLLRGLPGDSGVLSGLTCRLPGDPGILGGLSGLVSRGCAVHRIPVSPSAILAPVAAGVFAGSLGALGYSVICLENSFLFVAVWYTLGIGLSGLLGMLLGPKVLNW